MTMTTKLTLTLLAFDALAMLACLYRRPRGHAAKRPQYHAALKRGVRVVPWLMLMLLLGGCYPQQGEHATTPQQSDTVQCAFGNSDACARIGVTR